ncbi:MAG: DNA topoisomerase I [Gammaproteobacteria bacterium RIFCSPLOWO2_02_47_7]|nr:MAG: DNA topoisomerase I [Gammaproteobacteria bacterium RIFCSPLOWO2_02_47_7]OGT75807.1 MAG: DNA topoisomerase I [Gammaproteobacteria bacterium RIFCSPLOWO2_12_47_11]OGT87780.1 MAG: DNA topoisomerase I [Gammaproteobacteria bacterium RIFCSPLOWO2_12_FULL_47_76]
MTKALVIVESPAKAKTLNRYLGDDYEVLASYGHVRDLLPKTGAVDTDNNFTMKYEPIAKNAKSVDAIAKALKKINTLYLATDPDREGEAISWHLYELLKERGALKNKDVHRVVFYEVTKSAIEQSIAQPRDLSMELINAQQARRALDYLVGFNLSPLLWKKIRRGLSAGRVQSPALRMIVEREEEIEKFVAREYWTLEADLLHDDINFIAKLTQLDDERLKQFSIVADKAANAARQKLLKFANGKLKVETIEKKQRKRQPAAPFITSTLQQEAVRKLGFTAKRTMQVAQQLYEGIDIGDGAVGLITYMRTDSVTLGEAAIKEIRTFIADRYGREKVPSHVKEYKTSSKNAQEAHEGIRPTSVSRIPNDIKAKMTSDQFRLYDLVWKRTVASQMSNALIDTVAVDFNCGAGNVFRATGSTIADPGFMEVYMEGQDDSKQEGDQKVLPSLKEGDVVQLNDIRAEQHFTEPPPRYTEASLVKSLEEYGIGRPSTYASIISTLLQREYVELDNKRFVPTEVGRIVTNFLTEHFTDYVDYEFTAKLEDELDAVSRGEKDWIPLMKEFWEPFEQKVKEKEENVSRKEATQARELGTDPKTGLPVSVRMGRYGPYVQIGTKDDEDKPKFAGLRNGQRMDSITFTEAMELFKLPRLLGNTDEGEEVVANVGRFGPYVRYGSKFVSLKLEDDPHTINLERALELIAGKKKADAEKEIKIFGDSGISILNGRYGPYITDGKKNAKIPKDREPASLTLEESQTILSEAPARGKRRPRHKTG